MTVVHPFETTWGNFKRVAPVRRPYLDMPLLYVVDIRCLVMPCVLAHMRASLLNVNKESVNMVIRTRDGADIGLLDDAIVGFTIGYNDIGPYPGITLNGQTVIESLTAARYAHATAHHEMEMLSAEALWDIISLHTRRVPGQRIIDVMGREGTKYTSHRIGG